MDAARLECKRLQARVLLLLTLEFLSNHVGRTGFSSPLAFGCVYRSSKVGLLCFGMVVFGKETLQRAMGRCGF